MVCCTSSVDTGNVCEDQTVASAKLEPPRSPPTPTLSAAGHIYRVALARDPSACMAAARDPTRPDLSTRRTKDRAHYHRHCKSRPGLSSKLPLVHATGTVYSHRRPSLFQRQRPLRRLAPFSRRHNPNGPGLQEENHRQLRRITILHFSTRDIGLEERRCLSKNAPDFFSCVGGCLKETLRSFADLPYLSPSRP